VDVRIGRAAHVDIRRFGAPVLRTSGDGGYLSELFLAGTAAIAGLLVVAMAMQIAVAERAEGLAAEVVFTAGVHFVGVLIGLWGFIIGATVFAYAFCVFAYGVLPRWDGVLGGPCVGIACDLDCGRVLAHGAVLPGGRLLRIGAGRVDRALVPGFIDRGPANARSR
jgi:hypothetical protein